MSIEKLVVPKYGKDSFNCPNCEVYAHQIWSEILTREGSLSINNGFRDYNSSGIFLGQNFEPLDKDDEKAIKYHFQNSISISICQKCKDEAYWVKGELIYPQTSFAPIAHIDMPEDVKNIYNEARTIYDLSPRSAMALLRLALEVLLPQVGATKAKINTMIAELVKKGLPEHVQKSLDYLRVIGNEFVHPGEIDFVDTKEKAKENALLLFKILNFIVDDLVTRKNTINDLYESLPKDKKDGIINRDRINSKNI